MTTPPDSESASTSEANTQITQDIDKNEGLTIAQMMGGLVANQVTINQFQNQTPPKTIETATDAFKLGPNPYRGLLPFQEKDSDRFFGREEQIETLWKKLCYLYQDKSTVRVLSIYGPSGSGKSSLARAGLIPQLRKTNLPGHDLARLAVLVPGMHPLEALATELARIDTKDATLVEKSEDFERYLKKKSDEGKYDGLRRIANILTNSDIDSSPLIILVDQFEEVYTYLPDKTQRDAFIAERDAFIENLLCAAADRSQQVSVILTLRSDFLGKTQQHPRLNKLFSSQGFLVPIMQPKELEIAITEPAKRAGYELDKATVQLLVEESKGEEGALPLLQFALTLIWEELCKGIKPADTLEQIGGVVGALANRAKSLYEFLSTEKQKIARSIFLALIQLNDDRKATRRRVRISELITSKQDEPLVREVIECFARPGVWILVTFSNEQQVEMVEVAHEALIHNWKELEEWLDKHWENLRKKRKIDQEAVEWQDHRKSKDYLLQGRKLRDAREFLQAQKDNAEISLSGLAVEFVKASERKQRQGFLKVAIIPFMGTLIPIHFFLLNLAQTAINKNGCQQDLRMPTLVRYLIFVGQKDNLENANFCNDNLSGLNLSGATLWRANFRSADLENTIFRKAVLVEANFQMANLRGADLNKASLADANFQDSILYKTDLTTAMGLTDSQLKQSRLCHTKLPENSKLNADRDCQELRLP